MNKTIFLFSILFVFLLLYSPLSSAACSLGVNPLSIGARGKLGGTVIGTWNLYNLYEERITHVKIEKIQGPDWQIRFDPELHEASYEVSGIVQRIEENLALEKSSVVLEIPENPPKGVDYVKHPNQEGYIPVKPVEIYVTIPENAEIGQNYKLVFEAKGSCFSEPGAVIPGIAAQLEFSVKPTTEYYERPIEESEVAEEKEIGKIAGITGAVVGTNLLVGALITTTFILIVVIAFLLIVIKRSGLKKK